MDFIVMADQRQYPPGAGGWNVELHAEQDNNTVHWLSGVRQQCEQRLAQSLRQPVSLYLAKST